MCALISLMKTVDELRIERLSQLVSESGGPSAFAAKIERSPAQVSQWTTRAVDQKTGKPRRLSTDMCRYIETKLGKPEGWMDTDEPAAANQANQAELQHMVELMTLYASVPDALRPRVFKAVRGVIINLGGIAGQAESTND